MPPATRTYHVLIDSRDREDPEGSTPSHYRITLPVRLRNVLSARLISAEVPSSFYVFQSAYDNTSISMEIDGERHDIAIPDGNYSAATLALALNVAIVAAFPSYTFKVTVSASTLRMTIQSVDGYDMILDTTTTSTKSTEWGLAYYLGFEKNSIYAGPTITSPRVVSPNPYSYIVLDIEELRGVYEGSPDGGGMAAHGCFAKLPINANSFEYMYLDAQAVSEKPIEFAPPLASVDRLRIGFRFHDGRFVDFQSLENSFALEFVVKEPEATAAATAITSLPITQQVQTHDDRKNQKIMVALARSMQTVETTALKQFESEQDFRKKLWLVILLAGLAVTYLIAQRPS